METQGEEQPSSDKPARGRRSLRVLLAAFLLASVALQYYAHRVQGSLNGEGEHQQSILLNQPAPEFSLGVLETSAAAPGLAISQQVNLADHRGKVVLLSFWASWCRPCDYELPLLNQFYLANRERGVEVLAISTDSDREAAVRYAQERNLSLPMLWDEGGQVANLYRVDSLPTLVIIDTEGRIRKVETGLRFDMESWLRREVRRLQPAGPTESAGAS